MIESVMDQIYEEADDQMLIQFHEVTLDIFTRVEGGKKVYLSERFGKGAVGALPRNRAVYHIAKGIAHELTNKELEELRESISEALRIFPGKK